MQGGIMTPITYSAIIIFVMIVAGVTLTDFVQLFVSSLVATKKKISREIINIIDYSKCTTFVDAGSGSCRFLIQSALLRPQIDHVGIEISPILAIAGKLNIFLHSILNLKRLKTYVICGNFISQDLEKVDIIFCHLSPRVLEVFRKKAKRLIKKGTDIYSYKYEIPGLKALKTYTLSDKKKIYRY